jgi:chromosome segregation ATPase
MAGRVTGDAKESPVERVIGLLKDLKSQVETEGSSEATSYNEFACFCKDKNTAKVNSIDTRETESSRLTASIKQLTAKVAELSASIQATEGSLAAHEASLARATELRDKERAVYEETHLDTSNAVSGLKDALDSISGSKKAGLTQVKSKVQKVMVLADAAGLVSKDSDQVASLLQEMPEVPDEDYSFHSSGIIDLLKDLHKEWTEKKTKLENEEDAASGAFNKAAEAKRKEIQADKDLISTESGDLAEAKSDLASDDADLTEETALLKDDNTYLRDLTEQCERKAREWDQRSALRGNELAALSKALEIIEGTVLDRETNSGAGMRPDLSLAQKPAKTAMVQEEDDYSDVVFTQLKAVRKVQLDQPHQDPLRNKVISMLKSKGAKMNSAVLSVMAMKLAADPFAKVKTLIQQLIERLVREKTDEATQKGWCDTELAKAEHDRWYRHTDTESLSSNIGVLEARKGSLETKAVELKSSIKDLNKALTDATKIRSDEKADNKATLTNASEGLEALKQAITVLKDFYRKSSRAKTSLLQKDAASPVDQDGIGEHLGAYKGNQAQAQGILGMLATIQNDFEKTLKETTAAENQAHRDFVKFSRESKASISSQTRGLEQTENDLAKTNADLVSDLNDLKDNQKLLDSSLKTLETLRPACVDTGMTWDEKVARRTAEIEALKNALCVLDEEDKDIPECSGKLFLQK